MNFSKLFLMSVLVLSALVVVAGCEQEQKKSQVATPKPEVEPPSVPPELKGTIAEYAVLIDGGYVQVEGYSMVVGLGDKGRAEIDPQIKAYMVEYMRKNKVNWGSLGTGDITTDMMFRDPDHTIVRVRGLIPPGALKGSRFDIDISALPNNQTASLEGAVLMPAELHRFLNGAPPHGAGTSALAMGAGEIFLNPFLDPTKESDLPKLRSGRIIGGGKVGSAGRVLIQLYYPDMGKCERMASRINERFPGKEKVAVGRSQQLLELYIPEEFKNDYDHFTMLVMHLPMYGTGGNVNKMAMNVGEMIEQPTQRHEDLAMIWEAIGRNALPIIKKSYQSKNELASYLSARTGLRLGDTAAADVVLKFATSENSPMQIQAIRELGKHPKIIRAEGTLRTLLDSENEMVRLAAYESLRSRGDPIVRTMRIGDFEVDLVPTKRDYVVYATQTAEQRIVLFGANMPLQKPMFYKDPSEIVTINANENDKNVQLMRKLPRSGGYTPWLKCNFAVASLIAIMGTPAGYDDDGNPKGLGLSYGQIVGILKRMCADKSIPAKFVLQPMPTLQRITEGATGTARPDVGSSTTAPVIGN